MSLPTGGTKVQTPEKDLRIERQEETIQQLTDNRDYYKRMYEATLKDKKDYVDSYHQACASHEKIENAYNELKRKAEKLKETPNHPDPVFTPDRPEHYHAGGIDPFTFYTANMTTDQLTGYHVGSAIKYLIRAGKKGDAQEDFKKAQAHVRELVT